MKTIFFLIFLLSISVSFAGYTDCPYGTLIINKESNYQFEIADKPFYQGVCQEKFQNQYNYHTWCIDMGDGILYSTIREEYLGLVKIGTAYVLQASPFFDPTTQTWDIQRIDSTSYFTITQTRGTKIYALAQLITDNGAGLPHDIKAGVKLLSSCTDGEHKWTFQTIERAAEQPICPVTIGSIYFPGTFLRGDDSIANMQFGAFGFEKWSIIDTHAVNGDGKPIVCVKNVHMDKFLSLDVTGCPSIPIGPGCGSSSLDSNCGANEKFGLYTFTSFQALVSTVNPHVVLRMDGSGLVSFVGSGAGNVNGQVYPSLSTIGGYEALDIEPI